MDNDVTRLERVLRFEPEYIDTKPLIIEKSDNDILCWTWNIANLGWEFLGHIKLISRHKGRIALLDALKVTSDSFEGINPPEIAYPPDFEEKAWMVINRFYILRKQIIPVEISLKQKGSGCIISFTDSENYTTIHEVEIESVPDAITTLRAGYLFQTTIDNFMTWNVYHDIEYGDFEALKPLVETSTALRTRTKIPSLLQNMLEPEDDRIKLVLTHDESNCPVVKRGMKKHDSCWIIISHEDNMLDLSDIPSPLNGEQVYATLASGKIYSGSQKYSFDLELIPEYGNSAFSVFQEDRWILRLLREQGMNLIGMPVGSFIVSKEEKWKVVVNVEKTHLTWVLISETTGRQYGDGLVLIQFSTLDSIDDIVEATTEQILSHMTQDDLVDFELFPNKLRSLLTSKGLK